MEYSESSISNTISKIDTGEQSMFKASMDDEASRLAEGIRPEAISNEKIRKGDTLLDTYEVLSDAVHGGMGSVWCVNHKGWNVDLAMKRPQPKYFAEGSAERKEDFIRECENWIGLGLHPNIVSCYYVRDISGVPSIFSEWMDNGSLKDRIRDGSLYAGTETAVQKRLLDIAIQSARGLQYAHANHLVHQDVKPGNLLLTKSWETKLADFGLAKAGAQLSEGSRPLSSGYTREYCPKEQAEGRPAETWMDIYAWAVTVLEMYAGERFWLSGADVHDHFEDYCAHSRIQMPKAVQEILSDCIRNRIRDITGIIRKLPEVYEQTAGAPYFRPEPNAAADTADSLNNRALSYLDLGKAETAEQIWEQSASGEYGHADTMYNRAMLKWISGKETDLYLMNEISKVTDPAKQKELLRNAAVVRHDIPEGKSREEYIPGRDNEDITYQNSTAVSETFGRFAKGEGHNWILGREGNTAGDPGKVYSVSADGKSIRYRLTDYYGSLPSESTDGSVFIFCADSRIEVVSIEKGETVRTKKFPKDSILSFCAADDASGCYLGKKDGLYEYSFDTEKLTKIFHEDSGIFNIQKIRHGKKLLFCDGLNRLRILEKEGYVVTAVIPTELEAERRFNDLLDMTGRFDTAENETLLFTGIRDELSVYDPDTGALLRKDRLPDPRLRIWDIKGDFIIAGTNSYCQVWDMQKKICLKSFRSHAIHSAGFLDTGSGEEGILEGFVMCSFPSRYCYFRIPDTPPVPLWSLCRIRNTSEQTEQDEQFSRLIRQAQDALDKDDYAKAYELLLEAGKLPNRKNAPECWELYDELYPHFKRGKLTACTVTADLGEKTYPYAALGPDGSWFYFDKYRQGGEVRSSLDGQLLRKIRPHEEKRLDSGRRRLTYIARGSGKNQWYAEVISLPDGKVLFSKEFSAREKPNLKNFRNADGIDAVKVIEPSIFNGTLRMVIDPASASELTKEQNRDDAFFKAAKKNGMPYYYTRKEMQNGLTAFLYEVKGKDKKAYNRLEFYDRDLKVVRQVHFKKSGAYSDDITSPEFMPQDLLLAMYRNRMYLFELASFLYTDKPDGQELPVQPPFRTTSMSADCRYMFSAGKIYRMEWELIGE
ncbi:MAG: serine/threonine protein kinase [Solobacterium sp.]|nr:serine/threonine protein kinase [Solobacterium sp.]